MAIVEQVKWPDDTPLDGVTIGNFEAGMTSDVISARIFVDRNNPSAGAVVRNNFISLAVADPSNPDNKLSYGVAPLDEMWAEIRFTADSSSTISQYITDWYRLGSRSVLPFPEMVSDSYRGFEIRFSPPSFSQSFAYTFFILVHSQERVISLPFPGVDLFRGVIDGLKDRRQTVLISGSEVTAQSVADDTVEVARGSMLYRGSFVGFIEETLTINDEDLNSEPLDVGEKYYLMLQRIADGTLEEVKSVRADEPVKPNKETDKVFVCYILVSYNSPSIVISSGDIEMTTFWTNFYITQLQGSLYVRIHGGNYIGAGSWRMFFEPENILLEASSTNYIWLRGDGSLTAQTSTDQPDGISDLLYVVETDVSEVTSIEDRRIYAKTPLVFEISGACPATAPNNVSSILYVEDLLEIYKVVVQLDDNPGSGSDTIFDILVDGSSIFPNPLTVDTRPTFSPTTTDQISIGHHVVGSVSRGSSIQLEAIQYSGSVQPGIVKAFLYCR